MALIYNGKTVPLSGEIKYGPATSKTDIQTVVYNGVTVWKKVPATWVLKLQVTGSITGHSDASASGYINGKNDCIANVHVSGSMSVSLNGTATIPNVGIKSGTYSPAAGSSLSSTSLVIPEAGDIVLKLAGSTSGSGAADGGRTTGHSQGHVYGSMRCPTRSGSYAAIDGITFGGSISGSGSLHGWAEPGSNGGIAWCSNSHTASGSCGISITLPNLGGWTKATVSGGSATVNGTGIATNTVFAVKDTVTVGLSAGGSGSGSVSVNSTVTLTLMQ